MKHLINYKIFESNVNDIIDMILSDLDGEFDINDVYAAECSYKCKSDGKPYAYPELGIQNKSKPLSYFYNREIRLGKKMDISKYTSKSELRKRQYSFKLGFVIMNKDKDTLSKIFNLLNRERFNSYNLDYEIFDKPYSYVEPTPLYVAEGKVYSK